MIPLKESLQDFIISAARFCYSLFLVLQRPFGMIRSGEAGLLKLMKKIKKESVNHFYRHDGCRPYSKSNKKPLLRRALLFKKFRTFLLHQESRLALYTFQVINQTQFTIYHQVFAVNQVIIAIKDLNIDATFGGGRHQVLAILQFGEMDCFCCNNRIITCIIYFFDLSS